MWQKYQQSSYSENFFIAPFPSSQKNPEVLQLLKERGFDWHSGNSCSSYHRSKDVVYSCSRGMAWGTERGIEGLERLVVAFKSCQLRLFHTTGIHDNLQRLVMPNTKTDITQTRWIFHTMCNMCSTDPPLENPFQARFCLCFFFYCSADLFVFLLAL